MIGAILSTTANLAGSGLKLGGSLVGKAGSLAGPLLQGGGGILEGFLGSSQKKDEAKIYKYNAAVLFQRAKAVMQRTKFQQMRQAKEGARVQGELEAAIGGSGTVSTEGAPMLALALQRSESDLQNYLIGYEGRQEAKELESEALSYLMQAKRAKKAGRMSILGGFLGAGVSAIGSFLQMPKTTGVEARSLGSPNSGTSGITSYSLGGYAGGFE